MSTTALDITSVRARFSALDRRLAFFDGPGGTQCPDEVIDAISRYLREDNANIGAPYETSIRTTELVDVAHERAGAFLGCSPGETAFGQSMTALNFLLSRAFARTLREGDEIVVTALDHDASISPWLELAHDLGLVVHVAAVTDELELDYADLEAKLSDALASWRSRSRRTRSDSAGRAPYRRARAFGRSSRVGGRRPLRTARSDRRVGVGRRRPHLLAVQVLRPAHGPRVRQARTAEVVATVQGEARRDEPVGHRFEQLGTSQHELLAGFVAAVDYMASLGWDAMLGHERALGERFLAGMPENIKLYGLQRMEGSVPTFCFNLHGHSAETVARSLADRDVTVWHGDYYAVETMKYLALGRRRSRGHRPLQHRRRGRPTAGRSRRTDLSGSAIERLPSRPESPMYQGCTKFGLVSPPEKPRDKVGRGRYHAFTKS